MAVPPSSLVTMDVEKKKGVYDFMVRVGWVSPLGRKERTRGGSHCPWSWSWWCVSEGHSCILCRSFWRLET